MAEPQKWWEDPIYDFAFRAIETSFTGYGEDGVLQPSNPVDMVQTNQGPKMLHEGEIQMVKPDGSMAVIPANQASQGALRQMQAVGKIGGYEAGVDFAGNPINKPAQTAIDTGLETLTGYAQGNSPYQRTLANQTMTNAGTTAAAANAGLKMELGQAGADKGTIGTAMQVAGRDSSSNLSKLSGQLALGAQQEQLGAASTAASTGQAVKAQNYGQMTTERTYSDQETARINSDIASGMTYQAFSLVHPNVSEADFNARRTYTAAGQTDVGQAEKDWATAISAADLTNPTTVTTLQALYAKQHPGLPAIDLAGLTRDQQYNRTKQGQDITTGGLSIQALTNQIGNTQAEAAVKALNDGVPVATVNATYGTKLTQADADSITTEYRQRVKTTGLSITALENQIGNTQAQQAIQALNSGVPVATVNSTYGTKLTDADAVSITAEYNQRLATGKVNYDKLVADIGYDKAKQAINALNSGMPVETVNSTYGTKLTQADATSITAEYNQRLQTGNLNIQSIQSSLDAKVYETLKDKIANGMLFAEIQADPTLAGKISQAQYNYMASVRDINLDGLKNTLTREVFNTVKEQIDSNVTLDQVNATLPEDKKLTQVQYDAMHQVAQLSLDSTRQTLTDAKFESIKTMINSGSTYEDIRLKYPDFTLPQYDSMKTVYNLDLQKVRQSLTDDKYAAVAKMVEDGMSLATINLAYPGALNQAEYDAMNEVRKINVAALKLNYDTAQWKSIEDKIASGTPWETINSTLPLDKHIDQATYEAIRRYTAAGQTDFNNQLNAATIAFNSGDIAGGAATLNKLFPTANIDFSKLQTEQDRTNFYDGLSALSDFSQNPATFDEQYEVIKNAGVFDQLKIDTTTTAGRAKAKDLFDDYRLATDPIATMMNSISDESLTKLWPEETGTPEGIAAMRRKVSLFMISGGVTTDANGQMVISPAFEDIFGSSEPAAPAASTDATTYAGYTLASKTGTTVTFNLPAGSKVGQTAVIPIADVKASPTLSKLAGITPTTAETTATGDFATFFNTLDEGINVTQLEWEHLGKPKTYDAFLNAQATYPSYENISDGTVSVNVLKGLTTSDSKFKSLYDSIPASPIKTVDRGYRSSNAIGNMIQSASGGFDGYSPSFSDIPAVGTLVKVPKLPNQIFTVNSALITRNDSINGDVYMVKDVSTGKEYQVFGSGKVVDMSTMRTVSL